VAVPTKIHSLHDARVTGCSDHKHGTVCHPSHTHTPAWNVGVAGRVCGTAQSHQAQTVMTTYPGRRKDSRRLENIFNWAHRIFGAYRIDRIGGWQDRIGTTANS
jgi:hypothetical protein